MSNTYELVQEQVQKYSKDRDNLLAILQGIVRKEKYLSEEAMIEVAKALDISTADVYGTASFYSFLYTKPVGQNVIKVCKNISCNMAGKDSIIKTIEETLKIKPGETTADKKFTLHHANCLGWCHKGPAMLINDEVYTELTPQKTVEILGKYMQAQNN